MFAENGKAVDVDPEIRSVADDTYRHPYLLFEEQRMRSGGYATPVYVSRENRVVVVVSGDRVVTTVFATDLDFRSLNVDFASIKYKIQLRIDESRAALSLVQSFNKNINK